MSDAQRRLLDEVEDVLQSFGLHYEFVHRSKHTAVKFTANGKNLMFTLSTGADPRTALNAKADICNLIIRAGVALPEKNGTKKQLESTTSLGSANFVTFEPAELKESEIQQEAAMAIEPEKLTEKVVNTSYVRLQPDDPFLLYHAKQYEPSKVFVIELERDLVGEKGSLLVIPLHNPGAVAALSRELFDVMFAKVEAPLPQVAEPEIQPATVVVPEAVAGIPVVAEPLPEPVIVEPPAPAPHPWKKEKRKYTKRIEIEPSPNLYATMPTNINGLGPQPGRILKAIHFLTDVRHKLDLTSADIMSMLTPLDAKQVSARYPKLIDLGVIERGKPYEGKRGTHIRLTVAGRNLSKQIGEWPWVYTGFAIPAWATSL